MSVGVDVLESYFDRLWPICRSITGDGVRQSLEILREVIPLETHEVRTGTRVFDWEIPREWNIHDAYISAPDGRKIADFQKNNLHVVNYSSPVDLRMGFDELNTHLHTSDVDADAVPYVTSYYKESWGFCISQNTLDSMPRQGEYRVLIDSTLEDGSLTYGDLLLPGDSSEEILLSTYICHPSMANNELSGPLVTAFLYEAIRAMPSRHYSYRFVFCPETIGAIAYLAENGDVLSERVRGGYVVTCAGNDAPFTYKRSRRGDADSDRIAEYVLQRKASRPGRLVDFFPVGSDERQYCSPGFDLPVGSMMRSMYRTYPEYHTSLDNKAFISFEAMAGSVDLYHEMIGIFEANRKYRSTNPFCEPQLGKRGLYSAVGAKEKPEHIKAIMWVLSLADGSVDLLDIAGRSGLDFDIVAAASDTLVEHGLLEPVNP